MMRLTADMVLDALHVLEAEPRLDAPTTGDIERRVLQDNPGVEIHQGAVNARLKALRAKGRVRQDGPVGGRGYSTFWFSQEFIDTL